MLKTFLSSWTWWPEVLLIVATLGTLYTAGWGRLRHRGSRIAGTWQLALYLTGLATVCLALLSPIDRLASVLFLMHMLQHQLLMMLAAPLLLLANPLPACLWALPRRTRHRVGRLLTRGGRGAAGAPGHDLGAGGLARLCGQPLGLAPPRRLPGGPAE